MAENSTVLPDFNELGTDWLNASDNITEGPAGTPQPPAMSWAHVKDNFYSAEYVILPTFLVIGLFGNSLTIATMISKQFQNLTSRYILICLALSDTTLLLTQPFSKIFLRNLLGYDPRALSDASCKIFFHIFKTAKMTSSWLIVLLCFERFVAVVFPFKAKSIITKKIIFFLIALDYVFIGTYNAVWTFSSIVVKGVCKPDVTYPETKQKYRDFLLAGSSFYSLIPMLIMAILTPIIVKKLVIQRNKRRELSGGTGTSRKDAETIRISAMLIGVVVAYIVFILPITVVYNLAFWKGVSAFDTNTYDFFVLREVAQMLEQFNYSTNFFLYILCSATFRTRVFEILHLKKIFHQCRPEKMQATSSKNKTPSSTNQASDSDTAENHVQQPSNHLATVDEIVQKDGKEPVANDIINHPEDVFLNVD